MILIPRYRDLEPRRGILVPTRMAGYFKLDAIRPDGRVRPVTGWFRNLITNSGLDAIGTTNNWLTRCKVGTGNATPAVTDTALQAQVAESSTIQEHTRVSSGSPEYYIAKTITYRFAAGTAAGNLAEIGIGSSSTLFSRALILDGEGSPTTITILSDEVLDATYQLRIYPPLTDVADTITISGANYDITLRAASAGDGDAWGMGAGLGAVGGAGGNGTIAVFSGAIGAITGSPSGTGASQTAANESYGAGTYQRDFTASWGLSEANFGGVKSAATSLGTVNVSGSIRTMGRVQVEFDPVIPKDDTNVLSLVFRHSWARKTL